MDGLLLDDKVHQGILFMKKQSCAKRGENAALKAGPAEELLKGLVWGVSQRQGRLARHPQEARVKK